MVRHDVDIERGPPPSRMEKVITVLTKVFKVKRYVGMFFVAWVAFAFTCAHQEEITEFIPEPSAAARIPGRSVFRSDRTSKFKELSELDDTACININEDVNVRGLVMFAPTITHKKGKIVRVKVTHENGSVVTKERSRCVMVHWTDEVFTEHSKELCDNDAFCIQYLTDIIQSHARTEL